MELMWTMILQNMLIHVPLCTVVTSAKVYYCECRRSRISMSEGMPCHCLFLSFLRLSVAYIHLIPNFVSLRIYLNAFLWNRRAWTFTSQSAKDNAKSTYISHRISLHASIWTLVLLVIYSFITNWKRFMIAILQPHHPPQPLIDYGLDEFLYFMPNPLHQFTY